VWAPAAADQAYGNCTADRRHAESVKGFTEQSVATLGCAKQAWR
jgi:hypothetical protein